MSTENPDGHKDDTFSQAHEAEGLAEEADTPSRPDQQDRDQPDVQEAHNMAIAADHDRSVAAHYREEQSATLSQAEALDGYSGKYDALDKEEGRLPFGSEEITAVQQKKKDLVDEASATVGVQPDDTHSREQVRKALIGLHDGYSNSYSAREMSQRDNKNQENIDEHERRADVLEDLAQAVHRHPDITSADGRPLKARGVWSDVDFIDELVETASSQETLAKKIEEAPFSEDMLRQELRDIRRSPEFKVYATDETEGAIREVLALFEDDNSTLGLIKTRTAQLIRDQATSATTRAAAMRERIQPILDEYEQIQASKTKEPADSDAA